VVADWVETKMETKRKKESMMFVLATGGDVKQRGYGECLR
jgi:hypothetical protein